jgi:4-aminobutyrate aminotransferase
MERMSKEDLSPAWAPAFDLELSHAEGCYIYDRKGNRYLDFTSGIGVTNTGHSHPRVVRAIQEQAAKMIHGQIGIGKGEKVIQLTEELKTILPKELNSFFFSNSGAEAVEAAVKLAKQATGRQNVIVFDGSFHGRSHLTMAMTMSKISYRLNYQPLPSGVFCAPYAHCFHCPIAQHTMTPEQRAELSASCPDDGGKCCGYASEQVRHLFKTQTAPQETAAIVIEPELGEGGYVAPPASFLRDLRAICDEHGIVLIFDEIQTGFGRTGKWFAFERYGVIPDVLIMAKGIASGMPLSGLAAKKSIMSKWLPGSHGGTYGPNLVSAAAAVETIRVMREEKIVENADARGNQLKSALRELQKEFKAIGDIRGMGLMVGAEFVKADGSPDKETKLKMIKFCEDHKLLLLSCGTYENVIRWIPPLVVTEQQIDEAVKIFAAGLDQVAH